MLTEIDTFFATSLEKIIRDNLGETTFHSIQNRLFEKYGKKFLDAVCCMKSKQDKSEKRFTISDPTISKSILKAFSDDEMSKILNASIGEPWTISEILEKLDIPTTSGYRKINSLIEDGLLIRAGSDLTSNNRVVERYKSLFDNVNIDFNNKMTVHVQFTPEVFVNSTVLHTVYGE
jgi:hypothetical protein